MAFALQLIDETYSQQPSIRSHITYSSSAHHQLLLDSKQRMEIVCLYSIC